MPLSSRLRDSRNPPHRPRGSPESAEGGAPCPRRRTGFGLPRPAEDWARLQPIDDVIDHAPIFYAVHLWNVYDESLGRMAA